VDPGRFGPTAEQLKNNKQIAVEALEAFRHGEDGGKHRSRRIVGLGGEQLTNALATFVESKWPAWDKGKPMRPHQLARLLGAYGVRLQSLREHMTPEEVQLVCVQLKRDADAALQGADALSAWNFQRRFLDAIVVDDDFGGCPMCGKTDGYRDVGRDHWFVCHEHKKRWSPGSNLFSSWRDETEADWTANAALLNGYDEVEPLSVGCWPRDPKAPARAKAEWDLEKAWAERNRRVGNDPQSRIWTATKAKPPF
jgi:hypothetical protein